MNAQKYAEKVEYRRHDGRFHDFHVRNADKFRHEKRRRAMTGGMSCPPVEAAASTAPAKFL